MESIFIECFYNFHLFEIRLKQKKKFGYFLDFPIHEDLAAVFFSYGLITGIIIWIFSNQLGSVRNITQLKQRFIKNSLGSKCCFGIIPYKGQLFKTMNKTIAKLIK